MLVYRHTCMHAEYPACSLLILSSSFTARGMLRWSRAHTIAAKLQEEGLRQLRAAKRRAKEMLIWYKDSTDHLYMIMILYIIWAHHIMRLLTKLCELQHFFTYRDQPQASQAVYVVDCWPLFRHVSGKLRMMSLPQWLFPDHPPPLGIF